MPKTQYSATLASKRVLLVSEKQFAFYCCCALYHTEMCIFIGNFISDSLGGKFSRQKLMFQIFYLQGISPTQGLKLALFPALQADSLPSEPDFIQFSSVHFLSRVQLFATPWTTARQVSLSIISSRIYPNSCPLSRQFHPTISSSVVPFSSCLQSFPASGSFQMSQLFARFYYTLSTNCKKI